MEVKGKNRGICYYNWSLTLVSVSDRFNRQKISKAISELNSTINLLAVHRELQ
jgi:hypothetical protein